MKRNKRRPVAALLASLLLLVILTGCSVAGFNSKMGDIKGKLIGNSFKCMFYDNQGSKYLTITGKRINLSGNIVEDSKINSSDGSVTTSYGLSSVITVDIDGKQIQSCGDTVIFEEKGLKPDATFSLEDMESTSGGITLISNIINKYRNYFGKSQVVVVQSQLGVPICAYSGKDVYWEVSENLPKTTKLMIDKKALYLHRANFQIIDKRLIKDED